MDLEASYGLVFGIGIGLPAAIWVNAAQSQLPLYCIYCFCLSYFDTYFCVFQFFIYCDGVMHILGSV